MKIADRQKFRFELSLNDDEHPIDVVEAMPTAHPLLVVHESWGSDRARDKWTLTHGPTSAAVLRSNNFAECEKLARHAARLDPTGEILRFFLPSNLHFDKVGQEHIPPDALDVLRKARTEVGRRTKLHPRSVCFERVRRSS